MKKKEFLQLLEDHKQFTDDCDAMNSVGVDLFENKYPVATWGEKFFDMILKSSFNESGIDWINWFIYENDYGSKGYEANDEDGNLICQTPEGLWQYVKQYRI